MRLYSKIDSTSPEWRFFGLKNKRDTEQAVCRLCGKAVPTNGGSITCMSNHLRYRHTNEFNSICDMARQPKSSAILQTSVGLSRERYTTPYVQEGTITSQDTVKYSQTSLRWNDLTDAIAYCIVKDHLPLENVEKQSFVKMLEKFDGRYVLPSRRHFSFKAIPALCGCMREKIKCIMSSMPVVSMTCDIWSENEETSYISFAAHYVDVNWNLQIQSLDAEVLPDGHTANDMTTAIQNVTEDWDIDPENIIAWTIDSGQEAITACNLTSLSRISCFGHNLNSAVKSALKEHRVNRALSAARQLIAGFSLSAEKRKELSFAQTQFSLPHHVLISDNSSRWTSTFAMLERLVEQEVAVLHVLSMTDDYSLIPLTESDFEAFDSIVTALKPVADLAHVFCIDKYIGISAILPIHSYINETMSIKYADSELTQAIKSAIVCFLKKRFNLLPRTLLLKATLMDPRFKNFASGNAEETRKSLCLEFSYVADNTGDFLSNNQKLSLEKLLRCPNDNTQNTYCFRTKQRCPYEMALAEMERYYGLPLLGADADPFLWWKTKSNSGEFKFIPKLARKYLCARATTSTSDQFFSPTKKRQEIVHSKPNEISVTKSRLFTPRAKSKVSHGSVFLCDSKTCAGKSGKPSKSCEGQSSQVPWSSSTKVPPSKPVPLIYSSTNPSESTTSELAERGLSKSKVKIKTEKRNYRNISSRCGSKDNIGYSPKASQVKIENKKLDFSNVGSRCDSRNDTRRTPSPRKTAVNHQQAWDFNPVKLQCGSKDNINHKPVGGRTVNCKAHDFSRVKSRCGSKDNIDHVPGGGRAKINHQTMDLSHVKSKCASKDNINHIPGGGNTTVNHQTYDFSHVKSKCGSKDNIGHVPGGGKVRIEERKLDFSKVRSRCGSLRNEFFEPQFNLDEYFENSQTLSSKGDTPSVQHLKWNKSLYTDYYGRYYS